MAIAVTAKLQSFSATSFGTGAYTTGAFTPANNSLLVIIVQSLANASANIGSNTITDSLGAHLTYTSRAVSHYDVAFSQNATIFTAPVGTGASMTLTVDHGAQNVYQYVVTVLEITGHDTTTPTGGKAESTTDIGDGAETQTLDAAPGTNDITVVFLGIDDSGSAATATVGTGSWTAVYDGVSNLAAWCKYRTASTSTSVPITDVYTGAGAYDKGLMVSLVIKAASSGDATATPGVLATNFSFPAPTISGTATPTPSQLQTPFSFPGATVKADAIVAAPRLQTPFSFPGATITGDANTTASLLQTPFSFPAPTITTGDPNATATPNALATPFSFPGVTVAADAIAVAPRLQTNFSFPAATITGTATSTPPNLGTPFAFPSPTITGTAVATLSRLQTPFSYPAMTVVISNPDVTVTPSNLATPFSFPAPTASVPSADDDGGPGIHVPFRIIRRRRRRR